MSRSDWGELTKAGGLSAIVALVCVYVWFTNVPPAPNLPAYQYGQAPKSDYYPGGSSCKPEALSRLTGQKAVRERDRCAEDAENHRHDSDDLVQQTRAADAASASAYYAYRQTRLMLIEIIGGIVTLVAAVFAAIYARKAAIHTQESATEAKRAADAAEKQLVSSLHSARACITPESERVKLDAGDPPILRVEYRARNTGQTPAQGLLFSVSKSFRPFVGGGKATHLGRSVWNHGTVGPTHPIELYMDVTLTDDQSQMLEDGVAYVTLELEGHFITAFDERWMIRHEMVIEPKSLETGVVYTSNMHQGPQADDAKDEATNHEPGLDLGDDDP